MAQAAFDIAEAVVQIEIRSAVPFLKRREHGVRRLFCTDIAAVDGVRNAFRVGQDIAQAFDVPWLRVREEDDMPSAIPKRLQKSRRLKIFRVQEFHPCIMDLGDGHALSDDGLQIFRELP